MTDQLSDDEKALIAQHRAERKAAEDEQEFEYEIWKGDAGARFSSKSKAGKQAKTFFASLGIDLDDEPVQDEADAAPEEGDAKPKPRNRQQADGNVRKVAFQRRIS